MNASHNRWSKGLKSKGWNLSTELSLFGSNRKLEDLRPDDVRKAVNFALDNGVDVANNESFQMAFAYLQKEAQKREDRFSPASIKRFYNGWNVFVTWCIENNYPSLPTTSAIAEKFFLDKAETKHRNTINIYRWAIARMHRISGCPNPCDDEFVLGTLAGIRKSKAKNGENISQASAFKDYHLDELIDLWGGHESLLVRRDLAILAIAYESMLREAEITRIRIKDIKIHKRNGSATLTVPITKTNHSGNPDTVHLSNEAVALLREYSDELEIDLDSDSPGYVFRGVTKHNTPIKIKIDPVTDKEIHVPITTRTISDVFERAWKTLGAEKVGAKKFSGHSARIGAAQDLLLAGHTIPAIQQAGRWKSTEMVYRYCRDILAEQGAMAQFRSHRVRA